MPRRSWIGDLPTERRRDLIVLSCAVSAGIHGALVPDHFHEGAGAGAGFVTATVLLSAVVVAITLRPADQRALVAAAVVLFGVLAAYLLAVTTGLPVIHPEPESVDGLALATKVVEGAGLLAGLQLLWRDRPSVAAASLQPKGTLT